MIALLKGLEKEREEPLFDEPPILIAGLQGWRFLSMNESYGAWIVPPAFAPFLA